jgi:hypothetical protein
VRVTEVVVCELVKLLVETRYSSSDGVRKEGCPKNFTRLVTLKWLRKPSSRPLCTHSFTTVSRALCLVHGTLHKPVQQGHR